MAIVYPLSLPSVYEGIASVTIRANSVVGVNRSPYTGSQQVVVYDGQWWEMDVTLPRLTPDKVAGWEAWLRKLNGQEGTFLLGDPLRPFSRGVCAVNAGTPLVDGAVAARAQIIPIKNAPLSISGWMLAGDYIQIGSGISTRLYQLLDDVGTDGAGDAELAVFPKTRAALAGDETVIVSNPKGLFRMATQNVDVSRDRIIFSNIQFSATEHIA